MPDGNAPAKRSAVSLRAAALLVPIAVAVAVMAVSVTAPTGVSDVAITLGQLLTIVVAAPLWAVVTLPVPRFTPRDPAVPGRRAFDEAGLRALVAVGGLIAVGAVLWLLLDAKLFTVPQWSLTAAYVALVAVALLPRLVRRGAAGRKSRGATPR